MTRLARPQVTGAEVPQAERPSGFCQASTRLFPVSATYMIGGLTLVSKATEEGLFNSRPSTRLGAVDVSVVSSACCPNSRAGKTFIVSCASAHVAETSTAIRGRKRKKNLEGMKSPKNSVNGFTLAMRVPLLIEVAAVQELRSTSISAV